MARLNSFLGHALAYGVKGIALCLSNLRPQGLIGGHGTVPTAGDDAHTVHVSFARPEVADLPAGAHPSSYVTATIDIHRRECVNQEPHSIEITTGNYDLKKDGKLMLPLAAGAEEVVV